MCLKAELRCAALSFLISHSHSWLKSECFCQLSYCNFPRLSLPCAACVQRPGALANWRERGRASGKVSANRLVLTIHTTGNVKLAPTASPLLAKPCLLACAHVMTLCCSITVSCLRICAMLAGPYHCSGCELLKASFPVKEKSVKADGKATSSTGHGATAAIGITVCSCVSAGDMGTIRGTLRENDALDVRCCS